MIRKTYETGMAAWTKVNHKKMLTSMLKRWTTDLKKHARGNTEHYIKLQTLHAECYGRLYWQEISFTDLKHSLPAANTTTCHRLHTSRKRSLRTAFSSKVRSILQATATGRVKRLISLVFGPKKKYNPLDFVIKDDIHITGDRNVAEACRNEFIPWFRALPDDGTHISNHLSDWTIFDLPPDDFHRHFQRSQIPQELINILHTAIQHRPTPAKLQTMQDTLLQPPTFDEFTQTLKKTKENSAPGVSGLTYNMIKLWPPKLLQCVYDILAQL
jgi:hypothetical protein